MHTHGYVSYQIVQSLLVRYLLKQTIHSASWLTQAHIPTFVYYLQVSRSTSYKPEYNYHSRILLTQLLMFGDGLVVCFIIIVSV